MSNFFFPKNINEYEKAVKEWSSVRKQLNDKVVATKLGDQLIEESQSKQPQTKLLQEIASSLTRQVPVIDTATRLEKPGEFKTEKLIDSVTQLPNQLNMITKLLTVTDPNSVPYLVIDKLNQLSNVISNSSSDQLEQLIETNDELKDISTLIEALSTDVIIGSLNKDIIIEDIGKQINETTVMNNDEFYDELYRRLSNSGFNSQTISVVYNNFINPIMQEYENENISDENVKSDIMKEIINNIGIKNENVENSLDRHFKRLGTKLDDITFDTKTIKDTINENKIAEEKMVDDIENIKEKLINTTKIKDKLIKNVTELRSSPLSTPIEKGVIKKKIKDNINDLNSILPDTNKIRINEIRSKESINKIFNKTVNKTIINDYKDTLRKSKFFDEIYIAPYRNKELFKYDVDWDKITTDKDGNFLIQLYDSDLFLDLNNMIGKNGNFNIKNIDNKSIFNETIDKKESITERGYVNLLFLPWESIERLYIRGLKPPSSRYELLPLIKYNKSDIDKLRNFYESIGKEVSINDPNPKVRLAAGDPEIASKIGIKLHKKKGKGIIKDNRMMHKYTTNTNGEFGDLIIDLPELHLKHRIKAINGSGITVMDMKADNDLIDLLTKKRYNPKKVYSEKSVNQFKELVKQSGLPIQQSSGKYSLINPKSVNTEQIIKIFKDPNDLIDRMAILVGEIDAGNNSYLIHNELMNIIDVLFQKGIIDKKMHKSIYKKYLN